MGQLTIYLDSDTEKTLEKIVRKKGLSKSKWIRQLIREKAATSWPDHIAALAGAWSDFPTVEENRKTLGRDAKRDRL